MLEHGGRVRAAARRHGIPAREWLDLSTGINPWGYPVPPLPAEAWGRLPEEDDLEIVAAACYGGGPLLAVPGTQAAIQLLPRLRQPGRVAVLAPGYAEHARAWAGAGHRVAPVAVGGLEAACAHVDVAVLCRPNNPDGFLAGREALLAWAGRLAHRGGWLVVDEAFMDLRPGESLVQTGPRPGLVVLRSPGKFFGLAGARLGFVHAEPAVLARLAGSLGPWPVSGPARWAGRHALADSAWQERMRARLAAAGARLAALLERHDLAPEGGTPLYQWLRHPEAAAIAEAFARRAILVRHFPDHHGLRFGLPGDEPGWQRLEAALAGMVQKTNRQDSQD